MVDRTPDEIERAQRGERQIEAALDRAVDNYASWLVAEHLGLSDEETERWVNSCYDDLRDALTPQQMIRAVLLCIQDRAERKAYRLIGDTEPGESR